MSISLLYGCFQVELAVPDLDAARTFMERILGAAPIEQQLVGDLRALVPDDYGIDHLDCGGATFQLNEPSPTLAARGISSVHQRYLDEVGPCLSNLNFYVDDIAHARELLTARGAETFMEGPSSIARSLGDYGPENTRPGAESRPFLYLGARHLLGFDLELMEPNFLHFTAQTVQQPCFVGVRPGTGVPGLRLRRLTIAVPDIADTYRNLLALVAPGSRSEPYGTRAGPEGEAFRVTLGGIELEYCQPTRSAGALASHLERYGPGVVTIEFGVPDVALVLDRLPVDRSVEVTAAADLVGDGRPLGRWRLAARDLVGFDIVIEELHDPAFIGGR
jgi:catechol 2,3-dioxygenase-like lactoylglutathione lyase family enzyme